MNEKNSIISAPENLIDQLMQFSCDHFSIVSGQTDLQVHKKQQGYNPFPSFFHKDGMNSYVTYDMKSSLQINLLVCSQRHITSVTADDNSEIYYERPASHETQIFSPRRQNFFQLTFILSESGDLLMERENILLPQLSAILTNPMVLQSECRHEQCAYLHIGFKRESIQDIQRLFHCTGTKFPLAKFFLSSEKMSQAEYIVFRPQKNFAVETGLLLKQIFSELLEKNPGYLTTAEIYLGRLLMTLSNTSDYNSVWKKIPTSAARTVFEQTLNFIHAENRKLSRQEIATHLHYNGSYISRVFQVYSGISMADYIRNICLTRAAWLLLHSNLTIQQIMTSVGYENKTVFYHNFEQAYGMKPGKYRRTHHS